MLRPPKGENKISDHLVSGKFQLFPTFKKLLHNHDDDDDNMQVNTSLWPLLLL